MHEMSIIAQAVNSLEELAVENQISKITEVTLEIGKMRAAVPELLTSAFQELAQGTIFEGANLKIIEKDLDLECRACGRHIEAEDSLLYGCPACGSHKIKLLSGNELKINSIKGIE